MSLDGQVVDCLKCRHCPLVLAHTKVLVLVFDFPFIPFHTQAASTTVIKKHTRTHALTMAMPMPEIEQEARINIHTSL